MRPKLLLAAPALALTIAAGIALRPTSAATQPVAMTAVVVEPSAYAGPTFDQRDELAKGRQQMLANMDAWFTTARQAKPPAAPVVAMRPARPQAAVASSPDPPAAPVDGGDAEAAVRTWFPDIFSQAWGVSECESHHDPSAISPGGGNWGLFQINTVHRDSFTEVTGQPWSAVLNANYNAQFARWLHDSSGGWGPWACKWAAR